MVRRKRSIAPSLVVFVAVASAAASPLGCSGTSALDPGTSSDAGEETSTPERTDAGAPEEEADAGTRRPCRDFELVPEGATFCDDFDATDGGVDGGFARWGRASATGGSVSLVTGDAVSPPAFVRTTVAVDGGSAALVRQLPGSYTIVYEADLRVVKRPVGAVQLQRISIPEAHFVLFIELGATSDRLVEQYADDVGYHEDAVPVSQPLPTGAWAHVEMGADVGDSAFRFWLTVDGVPVASKRLRGAQGSASFYVYAGQVDNDGRQASAGGVVDVDNVFVTLK